MRSFGARPSLQFSFTVTVFILTRGLSDACLIHESMTMPLFLSRQERKKPFLAGNGSRPVECAFSFSIMTNYFVLPFTVENGKSSYLARRRLLFR